MSVKQFNPEGKLVVHKASGLKFGGRFYKQGEHITDSTLTLRKKRQLYFQNHLVYDYELVEKIAENAEAVAEREELVRLNQIREEREAQFRAEQEAIDREAAKQAQLAHERLMAEALGNAAKAAGQIAETAVKLDEVLADLSGGQPVIETVLIPQIQIVETVVIEPVVAAEVEQAITTVEPSPIAPIEAGAEFSLPVDSAVVNVSPDAAAPIVIDAEVGEAGPRRRVIRRATE